MFERKFTHFFSLEDSFPKFIHSVDNVGNKYIEIELIKDLCTTKGRILDDSFVLKLPPMSTNFFDYFFGLMKKLAKCFEYISVNHICKILNIDKLQYPNTPNHLKYKDIKGFVDMTFGPAIIYSSHMVPGYLKNKRMIDLIKTSINAHGFRIRYFNELKSGRSCNPFLNRGIIESGSDIPSISINGLSLVLESSVNEIMPGYTERYPELIIDVRGIGRGIALSDILHPNTTIFASRHNILQDTWGPLYPSILTKDVTEEWVIVPKLDG